MHFAYRGILSAYVHIYWYMVTYCTACCYLPKLQLTTSYKMLMLHKFGVDIKNARLYKQLHINFSVDTLN